MGQLAFCGPAQYGTIVEKGHGDRQQIQKAAFTNYNVQHVDMFRSAEMLQ